MKNKTTKSGTVYLIGAGPGEPGLLTLRAAKLIGDADVIVYDRLVSSEILALAENKERIYVGKNLHAKNRKEMYIPQPEINRLLVKLAKQGKTVARLKGGDPFVFGRGGEEASTLKKNKIAFEVVPGITAGIAAPAYAGIPMTDRRKASEVTFVTAHEDPKKGYASVNWEGIAKLTGTLVLYMAIRNLESITETLIRFGKPRATSVSVIEWATCANQRIVDGSLLNIAAKVRAHKIKSPAIVVVGEVTRLRKELDWFKPAKNEKPLHGKTVLVTRAQTHPSKLKESLKRSGANVLELPAIEILPPVSWTALDQEIKNIHNYDWVILTSVPGVASFVARTKALGLDARKFSAIKFACVGEATRDALAAFGIRADFVPKQFTSAALARGLQKKNFIRGKTFLLAQTQIAPKFLRVELARLGATKVKQVIAYRTLSGVKAKEKQQLSRWIHEGIDYVTFTSASTVDNFFKAIPKQGRAKMRARFISIGPVTSAAMKKYGVKPHREARPHTIPGILKVLNHG